ncbi:MAG: hypothetical protein ACXWXV_02635 [Aeromicrobium sp.]
MEPESSDTDEQGSHRRGLLQSAVDLFLDRTRAVGELVGSAGSGAVGALPDAVPETVTRMLSSLQQVVDQIPPLTAELDILIKELHAKRLSIQALQAELAALDDQLGVLEQALAPVQSWSIQWNRVRQSLTETLRRSGAADSDQP